jgi:hypothetical protein
MGNSKLVIGDTVTDANVVNGIVVPRYLTHPDRIWTYGTYDDHFDGSTLNAKWNASFTAGGGGTATVAASHVTLMQPTPSAASFNAVLTQSLPTGVDFTISLKMRASGYINLTANAQAGAQLSIYGGAAASGLRIFPYWVQCDFCFSGQHPEAIVYGGANFGTSLNRFSAFVI